MSSISPRRWPQDQQHKANRKTALLTSIARTYCGWWWNSFLDSLKRTTVTECVKFSTFPLAIALIIDLPSAWNLIFWLMLTTMGHFTLTMTAHNRALKSMDEKLFVGQWKNRLPRLARVFISFKCAELNFSLVVQKKLIINHHETS